MSVLGAARAAPPTAADGPTIWGVAAALWAALRPLLAIDKPRKEPGRPRADGRRVFDGLSRLARAGAPGQAAPARYGPKSTVHDRLTGRVAHGCLAAASAAAAARGYTVHLPPPRDQPRAVPPPGDPARHPPRHPPRRWVVEAGPRWFNRSRRRPTRWEKKAAHYLAFAHRAAGLIIQRKVRHAQSRSG
jgi:transposase